MIEEEESDRGVPAIALHQLYGEAEVLERHVVGHAVVDAKDIAASCHGCLDLGDDLLLDVVARL